MGDRKLLAPFLRGEDGAQSADATHCAELLRSSAGQHGVVVIVGGTTTANLARQQIASASCAAELDPEVSAAAPTVQPSLGGSVIGETATEEPRSTGQPSLQLAPWPSTFELPKPGVAVVVGGATAAVIDVTIKLGATVAAGGKMVPARAQDRRRCRRTGRSWPARDSRRRPCGRRRLARCDGSWCRGRQCHRWRHRRTYPSRRHR